MSACLIATCHLLVHAVSYPTVVDNCVVAGLESVASLKYPEVSMILVSIVPEARELLRAGRTREAPCQEAVLQSRRARADSPSIHLNIISRHPDNLWCAASRQTHPSAQLCSSSAAAWPISRRGYSLSRLRWTELGSGSHHARRTG